jgi:hypothetical protein
MSKTEARRTTRELGPDEARRLEQHRERIAGELPEMVARDRMRKEAREEATLSGELRRAIHASDHSLTAVAQRAGVPPLLLDDFLTGERTLRSDVLDRLADVLGCQLTRAGS